MARVEDAFLRDVRDLWRWNEPGAAYLVYRTRIEGRMVWVDGLSGPDGHRTDVLSMVSWNSVDVTDPEAVAGLVRRVHHAAWGVVPRVDVER